MGLLDVPRIEVVDDDYRATVPRSAGVTLVVTGLTWADVDRIAPTLPETADYAVAGRSVVTPDDEACSIGRKQ